MVIMFRGGGGVEITQRVEKFRRVYIGDMYLYSVV